MNWDYEIDRLKMHLRLIQPVDWKNINKYFIISTGRTGTKFLAKFFNEIGKSIAVHEPNPDFLKLAINYAQKKVNKEKTKEKLDLYRRPLARKIKRSPFNTYIESNNRLFSLIEPLTDVFENFKIIHIVRDGRDYVRSGMSRDWYTPNDDELRLKSSMFPDDPYFNVWNKMNRFEKICWRWQKKDNFIYEDLKTVENSIRIKFRDIFNSKDHNGLFKIADYIGISKTETSKMIDEMINKKVNNNKQYEIPRWPEWSKNKRKKFNQIAGKHMNKYFDYK